ncbi:hypothetical protein EIP86_010178 [Pleurotus ostreatoroseus]|nr:hypothetical protein EIP86_010178 [Pleurotus ostreatoroseus]
MPSPNPSDEAASPSANSNPEEYTNTPVEAVPVRQKSWNDLDGSILREDVQDPDALKRLLLMCRHKGRHYVTVRAMMLLYRICRVLVAVCKQWNSALQAHPYWAIFCSDVKCEKCKAESPSTSPWHNATTILRRHCLPCLHNNLEGSHFESTSTDHSHPRLICRGCVISDPDEDSKDSFNLLPRSRYWDPIVPDDDAEAETQGPFGLAPPIPFHVKQEFEDVDQPTISVYCQCCRTARLELALRQEEFPTIDQCRRGDVFMDALLRAYIDEGYMPLREVVDLVARQLWMLKYAHLDERRLELYDQVAESTDVMEALESQLYEHHEGTAALVAASPNLRHYMAVEDRLCSMFVEESLRAKILYGDWVNSIEPSRPPTIRAEHPAKCHPVLTDCYREITWVADKEMRMCMGRKPSIKVAKRCLRLNSNYLHRLFEKMFSDILSMALWDAMVRIVSTVSARKSKPGAKVVKPCNFDLERVNGYLRHAKTWQYLSNPLMDWDKVEEIPLIPTKFQGLPQSTLDIIQRTWDRACATAPAIERNVSAARSAKRPRSEEYHAGKRKSTKRQKTAGTTWIEYCPTS